MVAAGVMLVQPQWVRVRVAVYATVVRPVGQTETYSVATMVV